MSTTKFKIVILLSGRGSNFKSIFEHIQAKNLAIEIVLVLSDQESSLGLAFAREHNIKTAVVPRNPKNISNQQFNVNLANEVKKHNPDLIILAGFMRVLTEDFINCFPTKIINIHPSLLPAFKGLYGQQQAFQAGVKFAGCTVHLVIEDLDAGPIIAQAVVPVLANDNESLLADRILKQEHKILPAVVEAFAKNEIIVEKNSEGKTSVSFNSDSGLKDTDSLISIKL